MGAVKDSGWNFRLNPSIVYADSGGVHSPSSFKGVNPSVQPRRVGMKSKPLRHPYRTSILPAPTLATTPPNLRSPISKFFDLVHLFPQKKTWHWGAAGDGGRGSPQSIIGRACLTDPWRMWRPRGGGRLAHGLWRE